MEQRAQDGEGGRQQPHAPLQLLPGRGFGHPPGQPRPVKADSAAQPGAKRIAAVDGGVQRQVAALGVPAQFQHGRGGGQLLRQAAGHGLGGNLLHEGQVEVLLPPGQGVVRAAIGNVDGPVRQSQRQRGELPLLGMIVGAGKALEGHALVAAAAGQQRAQAFVVRVLVGEAHLRGVRVGVEGRLGQRIGQGLMGLGPAQIQVCQLGENQPVHVAKGQVVEGMLSAGAQILQQARASFHDHTVQYSTFRCR